MRTSAAPGGGLWITTDRLGRRRVLDALDRSGLARRFELVSESDAAAGLALRPATGHGAASVLTGRGLRASTAARRAALLAEATLAIEHRHAEPGLSLHDIAREVATSDRQLQRVFAELAGSSFRDELGAVRMQHGAALLQTTACRCVTSLSASATASPRSSRRGQRPQRRDAAVYLIESYTLNSGMYIEITMNPTMPPTTTSITGSRIDVSDLTADATWSS